MATVMYVVLQLTAHVPQAHRQVMVGAAHQEACTNGWFFAPGFVASKSMLRHIVGCASRMTKGLRWKLASHIDPPWTLGAWLLSIAALPAFNRYDLVIGVGRSNSRDPGDVIAHGVFSLLI
ncbi:hypothetical protein RCH05_004041 [Janthinobacterium sp. CAN_S7]